MSHLKWSFPEGDPRFVPAASVRLVCPHHLDELLVEWSIAFPDPEIYFMTESVWVSASPGYQQEIIGPQLSAETHESARLLGLDVADPVVAEGDVPHWRDVLRCTRPSCHYDAQFRGHELRIKVTRILRGMVAVGWRERTFAEDPRPQYTQCLRPVIDGQ